MGDTHGTNGTNIVRDAGTRVDLRWSINIDTARFPGTEIVRVKCPVCQQDTLADLYLNCVVPPVGVTLEEALTVHAEETAHAALAKHLLDGGCQWARLGESCTMGRLFADRHADGVYWLVQRVTDDDDPGSTAYVVVRWTADEISRALESAKETHSALHRKLREAKDHVLELRSLAQATDKLDIPF